MTVDLDAEVLFVSDERAGRDPPSARATLCTCPNALRALEPGLRGRPECPAERLKIANAVVRANILGDNLSPPDARESVLNIEHVVGHAPAAGRPYSAQYGPLKSYHPRRQRMHDRNRWLTRKLVSDTYLDPSTHSRVPVSNENQGIAAELPEASSIPAREVSGNLRARGAIHRALNRTCQSRHRRERIADVFIGPFAGPGSPL